MPLIKRSRSLTLSEADLGTKLVVKKPTKLHVENLSYKYPDVTHSVLCDLNFSLNSGETVAIVGPSGAGKTTLVNVLVRLLTPSSGNVFLDNQNINEIQLDDYRSHFAMLVSIRQFLMSRFYII